MKVDKRNPRHWYYLLRFALAVAAGLVMRTWTRRRGRPLVVFYGHKLNGNLHSLYKLLVEAHEDDLECVYLSMDPAYCENLRAQGVHAVSALGRAAAHVVANAALVVSDHGLHAMSSLPGRCSIRFADVWHGIPYKGWDANDFHVQHRYDEIWVSSKLIRSFYVDRWGFDAAHVHVTGYGRTDRLICGRDDLAKLRSDFGLPADAARVVLFAPTWAHESKNGEPLHLTPRDPALIAAIAEVCRAHHAVCLFRAHLNSSDTSIWQQGPFVHVPQHRFPDSEGILLVSDVLICDWSSIAFDFLLLDRPAIFLDIPAPFGKGFSLGPEYRYGAVAQDVDMVRVALDRYLADPGAYRQEHGERAAMVRRAAYDETADGYASQRYRDRVFGLLRAQN